MKKLLGILLLMPVVANTMDAKKVSKKKPAKTVKLIKAKSTTKLPSINKGWLGRMQKLDKASRKLGSAKERPGTPRRLPKPKKKK